MLALDDLAVRRGAERIVTGLSLEIRPGRIFWVVGPNGAGKSSLLRVLALLDPPAAGRVYHRAPPGEPFLYFHSEMALPASSTVGAWARLVPRLLPEGAPAGHTALWPDVAADRKVGRLSTGERKRLLLDALLRRPGPLLLDEPYEHLSPDAKAALTAALEARVAAPVAARVVVVATNQLPAQAGGGAGLRLEAGFAEPFGEAGP
ncbi:MAG TPA: ATP-binding cassette domain-containing protein [Longimicrobiales bacterium]|nr:ATP-binding cassette domain-containing protein [Longimicrobiales bacterium]